MKSNGSKATSISEVSNDGAAIIELTQPYTATVRVQGSAALLFHRWSNESVAEKAASAKGSKAKKTDDVDSYIWRDTEGRICLPGQYLVGSLTDPRNGAAKYRQDPRSPRKSALDLYRAGVLPLTELAPIRSVATKDVVQTWDFLDQRRVTVQRSGITRVRPAFLAGWEADVQLLVTTPEYIPPAELHACLTAAGRLVGVGDFRPTFGRFLITSFDIGLEG